MNTFPFVAVLSQDTVLLDLLRQLLTRERFLFRGVANASEVLALCRQDEGRPAAVLLDTIESTEEARLLLHDAARELSMGPSMLLLTGSTTSQEVLRHPMVDEVLSVPLCADDLIRLVDRHARAPKGARHSGPVPAPRPLDRREDSPNTFDGSARKTAQAG